MTLFVGVVHLLCAVTSLLCAVLLWRGYRSSRQRLLMWSAICFSGFFLNNVLLILDLGMFASSDLAVWRTVPALAGISCLVYGLIWDTGA